MWLQNTGLLDKFFIDVLHPPLHIPLKKIRVNQALDVQQLATAAIVMLVGIIISSFLFLGELCCGSPEMSQVEDGEKKTWTIGWDDYD